MELLVSMTIISIIAGLALSGLAASRQRAKIDKTKSTIRKLHEIIMPQYESYLNRRVSTASIATPSNTQCAACYAAADTNNAPSKTAIVNAWKRLMASRLLMVQEMPDQWADVYTIGSLVALSKSPTAPTRRYAAYKDELSTALGTQWATNYSKYEGAECLAMLVTRGGFATDASELFRTDELGDIDSDGAPEFLDGWGRPIGFIRWPAGYSSIIQPQNATTNPDPLDPMRISGDYALVPLIYSAGPDEATNDPLSGPNGYGVQTSAAAVPPESNSNYMGWLSSQRNLGTTRQGTPQAGDYIYLPSGIPDPSAVQATRDNITNHDLIKK